MKKSIKEKYIWMGTSGVLLLLLIISILPMKMGINQDDFLGEKELLREDLMMKGMYKCCLEKPCNRCLTKKEVCDCMEEIMNGEHPCGECMGEILEGEGNKFLAPYFARAIADELGEEHKPMLKEIIKNKYNVPIDKQA